MSRYAYPECTTACLTALSLFQRYYPEYRTADIEWVYAIVVTGSALIVPLDERERGRLSTFTNRNVLTDRGSDHGPSGGSLILLLVLPSVC